MATLRQQAGKLLLNAGKLTCACCCACKSPWCCNAPNEVFAEVSIAGGQRQSSNTFGSGSTAFTITLDFDFESPDGTYTVLNDSFFRPCGTFYSNLKRDLSNAHPSSWTAIPQITLGLVQTTPQTVAVSVGLYFANGKANYRRTGSVPGEELDRPFFVMFSKTVPAQSASGSVYPCMNWAALGELSMTGGVAANLAQRFNQYSDLVGNAAMQMPPWSPALDLKVSFSV